MSDGPTILPTAVVLGLSPTGLHVVRTLGRAGVRVVGIGGARECAHRSNFIAESIVIEPSADLLDDLLEIGARTIAAFAERPVLMPTADRYVEFVADNAGQLGEHFTFQDSYAGPLARDILSKDSFYAHCERLGLRYPKTWQGGRQEHLSQIADFRFPCLVKPVLIHKAKFFMNGRKVWIVRNRENLSLLLARLPDEIGDLLVQEIVPGPESEIVLYCSHVDRLGRFHQSFTARKLRQFPPGFGSASLVQSSAETEASEISEALLSGLGYTGIAALEFKRSSRDGKLYVIEMNPRTSLWFSVSEAAGRPVVLSAYSELAGLSDALPETPQVDGVRWRDPGRDAASSAFYRIGRGFVLPAPDVGVAGPARSHVSAVYAPGDEGPFWSDMTDKGRKALTRMLSRRARRSGQPLS